MFGIERRRKAREEAIFKEMERRASLRPDVVEAVREALSSQTRVVLRPPMYKIEGDQGRCVIRLEYPEMWTNLEWFVSNTLQTLRQVLGTHYMCSIHVRAQRPTYATELRHQLSPGWRNYADEYQFVYQAFETETDLVAWLHSPEGVRATSHHYSISVTAKQDAVLHYEI